MQKIKNWVIDKLLHKDGLVAVPEEWQTEYVSLAADKVKNKTAFTTIINEFNDLLRDYLNKHSISELKAVLKENEVVFKSTASKEELVELAYQEFRMAIE